MNCAEFWNQMPELASGANPEHNHAAECPACAALLERQRRLASGLRTMAGDMRSVGAPPRLESNLLEAFRSQLAPAAPRPMRARWTPVFSWAAAVAAVIA